MAYTFTKRTFFFVHTFLRNKFRQHFICTLKNISSFIIIFLHFVIEISFLKNSTVITFQFQDVVWPFYESLIFAWFFFE